MYESLNSADLHACAHFCLRESLHWDSLQGKIKPPDFQLWVRLAPLCESSVLLPLSLSSGIKHVGCRRWGRSTACSEEKQPLTCSQEKTNSSGALWRTGARARSSADWHRARVIWCLSEVLLSCPLRLIITQAGLQVEVWTGRDCTVEFPLIFMDFAKLPSQRSVQ